MAKVDASSKRTIHLFARAWAEWVVEQEQLVLDSELSGEFQFIARNTDVLLKVRDKNGSPFLSLTELQLRYDSNMARRLAAYAALGREKYKLDVYVSVIYLVPPPKGKTIERLFHSEFSGQVAHQDFRVIALWELDAKDALKLNNPALLPFVPLMRGGNTKKIFHVCLDKIHQLPEAEDMEPLLFAFASLVMSKKNLRELARWSMSIIKDSPFYRDLVMPLEEAVAEARDEALHENTIEMLSKFLTYRFGAAEKHYTSKLRPFDLVSLQQLTNVALDVGTLTEFEQVLSDLSSKAINKAPAAKSRRKRRQE